MGIINVGLAAGAVVIATSFMALQPTQANELQSLQYSTQLGATDMVLNVGWKKRRLRRFLRRNWRHHHRHGHFHGHIYGFYPGARCHAHNYKVRGIKAHPYKRCGHRHYRAYNSWTWL